MTRREVRVVPHDPAWAEAFEDEAALLRSVLGREAVAVHHIGSTSVPGLAAKPTIDALVEVLRIEVINAYNRPLAERGYEAWGEHGIVGRRFFTRDRRPVRTHNVHVFEAGTLEAERHLAFKNYLIHHPETARAYATLKRSLAQEHPADREAYVEGKDAFIKRTEREALSWTRTPDEVS